MSGNLIQRGDIHLKLKNYLGLKGRGQTPTVAHTVQPVLIIDSIAQSDVDYRTTRHAAGTFLCPASAGQNPRISLTNPGGSGILAKINTITVWSAAGLEFQALSEPGNAAIPTIIPFAQGWVDSRLRKTVGDIPLLVASYQYSAGLGIAMYVRNVAAGGSVTFNVDLVLEQGQRLLFEGRNAVGADMRANVEWTEENVA